MITNNPTEPVNAANSKYKPQPLPDISKWSSRFTGWSIWFDVSDSGHGASNSPQDLELGLLIAEKRVATKRIFRWTALFVVIAVILGVLAFLNFGLSTTLVLGAIALIFFCAALYRFMTWYLNKDLKIGIFREGFALTKNGKTQKFFWRDLDYVREKWRKASFEEVIQENRHKIEIYALNGQKVEMDRTFENIEEIGGLIQLAMAEYLLPGRIETLKNDGTCDFGSFKISRYGITYRDKKFLPWNKVKELNVQTIGQTTLTISELDGSKWTTWATENGGTVLNLRLFLILAYWLINAAKNNVTDETDALTSSEDQFDGTEYCKLFVTKKQAQQDSQRTLYVGTSKQERRLVVKIPAGVKSGTVYRFPDYGRPNPKGGAAGILNVEITVEAVTQFQANWEVAQMTIGVILFILGMIVLISESAFDLITSAALAVFLGGICGTLISIRKRWAGVISGAIGGGISYFIHIIYLILMYQFFGRESFWNYEMVVILFISVLPGIGLYLLLTKKRNKENT